MTARLTKPEERALAQRQPPIRSKAIRKAAAGQRCTLELPGICCRDEETTVFCHVHDEQFGRSQKADDISGFFGCYACHTAYDLHRTGLNEADELRSVMRAMQRTLRRLVLLGIVVVPEDPVKPFHARAVKPRKPRSERKAIVSRGFNKSLTRKLNGTVLERGK